MNEHPPDVLELLVRHELAIKRLYETFAGLFPHRSDFWRRLASEEQKHADWLTALQSGSMGQQFMLESHLKAEAISLSIAYVDDQSRKAAAGNFSAMEALAIARDIENALLEKQFSKLRNTGSSALKSAAMNLAAETEKHRSALVQAIFSEQKERS
jgi:hypothetical protein